MSTTKLNRKTLNTGTNYSNVQNDFFLKVRTIHHFMFYCLNNGPTAWRTVLREKLPVPQLVRNYPHFMECKGHLSFVPVHGPGIQFAPFILMATIYIYFYFLNTATKK
jgi:hypothetical protein